MINNKFFSTNYNVIICSRCKLWCHHSSRCGKTKWQARIILEVTRVPPPTLWSLLPPSLTAPPPELASGSRDEGGGGLIFLKSPLPLCYLRGFLLVVRRPAAQSIKFINKIFVSSSSKTQRHTNYCTQTTFATTYMHVFDPWRNLTTFCFAKLC